MAEVAVTDAAQVLASLSGPALLLWSVAPALRDGLDFSWAFHSRSLSIQEDDSLIYAPGLPPVPDHWKSIYDKSLSISCHGDRIKSNINKSQ